MLSETSRCTPSTIKNPIKSQYKTPHPSIPVSVCQQVAYTEQIQKKHNLLGATRKQMQPKVPQMKLGIRCIMIVVGLIHTVASFQSIAQEQPVCEFELDSEKVLNRDADKVGIWVNSNTDRLDESYVDTLRSLKIRSIRYGWQFGLFDPKELSSLIHSPRDTKTQGYLATDSGRMIENFGPRGVEDLLQSIDAVGFAVLSTDGINYIGTEDTRIALMSRDARIEAYSNQSAEWASWANKTRFRYFEIGNENDLTGGGDQAGGVEPWKASEYAQVARRYLKEIKRTDPNAKCGINGGLLDADKSEQWFREMVATDPMLADDLDFVVAHKYEFWLDLKVWREHADWDFGRLGIDYRNTHASCFPRLPVQVTELGSWKPGENTPHYRSVLATEMLGNVRMEMAVEHVQFWPTRWASEGGVLQQNSNELSGMGLGLAAYTRFGEPTMFANQVSRSIRCFAAKGKSSASVWLINHSDREQVVNVTIKNLDIDPRSGNNLWRLESQSGDPMATDTQLRRVGSVEATQTKDELSFSVVTTPCSATIIQFGQ
jgi:hypothetical protein